MKREQLVGQPITAYYAPEIREPILTRYRERFAAGSMPPLLERSIRLASGREVTFQISNSIVHTSEGLMLLGVFRDLTKEKQLEAELKAFAGQMEQLAAVDMLTGLANRRSLLTQLGTEFRRARRYGLPMSLVLLDLDNFKAVNDGHGHLTGDAALSRVGGILRSFARAVDVAGRYGGEEFLLVMPHTNLVGAVSVADRIRQSIEAAVIHDAEGRPVRISCSVGTVEMDAEVKTEQELIARADRALYKAKNAGRNRVETV
jgi:diguanylate cyclase (GGDEF)-like protein